MGRLHGVALVALVLASAPDALAAYTEAHPTAHDVRVLVDTAGRAAVDHQIAYRVVAGALHSIDLENVAPDAVLEPDAIVTGEDGKAHAAHVAFREQPTAAAGSARTVRVDLLDPKGIKRGVYVTHVRYTADLVATGQIEPDGALWRLAWTAPTVTEGVDGARVVFDLPAAGTEPRPVSDEAGGTFLPALRRGPERDELELVRPHVARGERVVWTARVDPKAFPQVTSLLLRPPPPRPVPAPPHARAHRLLRLAALAALALALGALVLHKGRRARATAERDRAEARPLVPLAPVARAVLAAGLLAGAMLLQLRGEPVTAAALLALVMATSTHLPPRSRRATRGPGAWVTLRPADAFAPPPADALDATTRRGAATLAALLLLALGVVAALRRWDVDLAPLAFLDALVLVPTFLTGTRSQRRPQLARPPLLKALHGSLRKDRSLRVVPWARVPQGAVEHDELRLLVLPRAAMPGVLGIEAAVAWRGDGGSASPAGEVLVRVREASAAAARMTTLAPVATVMGRRDDERVVRLTPVLPTRAAWETLLRRVAHELVNRRASRAGYAGQDRRVDPRVAAEAVPA